jgi:hypothetical protein
MKKLISSLALIFFVFLNPAFSNEKLLNSLKEGGKLIFIRQAHGIEQLKKENVNS